MKKIILTLISATLIISGCGTSGTSETTEIPKTPAELKAELCAQEKSEPLTYLTVDAKMQADQIKIREEGLFHDAEYAPDGNTIHGTIKNSATIAKFKDVVLTVTFYSQTETAIETKDYVIYEFYAPNSTKNFDLKVYPPETMAKFGVDIKSATAVD